MARRIAARSSGEVPGFLADLRDFARDLLRGALDPYRPELHYMRGPGPKWQAKHARPLARFDAVPGLVVVKR
jgi:hypothetical protein